MIEFRPRLNFIFVVCMLWKFLIQIFVLPFLLFLCFYDIPIVKSSHLNVHYLIVFGSIILLIFYFIVLIVQFFLEYLMISDILSIMYPEPEPELETDEYDFRYRRSTNKRETLIFYVARNFYVMLQLGIVFNHVYTTYSDHPYFNLFLYYFIFYNVIEHIQMYIVVKNHFKRV